MVIVQYTVIHEYFVLNNFRTNDPRTALVLIIIMHDFRVFNLRTDQAVRKYFNNKNVVIYGIFAYM
jgi:hypothetical protein